MIFGVLIFSVLLIVGPIVGNVTGHPLGTITSVLMTVSGLAMLLFSGILLTVTKLYYKTKASEAFVRTGMGGLKVIKDGGALVIPVIHQLIPVTLRTIRLEVSREGGEKALITKDKLRADICAEFFVKVQADNESIQAAARSFGEKMHDTEHVKKLVEDKLVSALRTVAATRTLEELNSEREQFMKQVTEIVTPDLEHNGLSLETATISKLDQTDPSTLRDDNIFDAQGKRTIAEITQRQLTERNLLEREGEKARKDQDVQTRKAVLALEQAQKEAEAAQAAEVAKVEAEKSREATEKKIEAERQIELASVEKQRQLEVAQRQQQQAVEVAERTKQQAVIKAEQEVEVAERAKQQAVAQAEAERAVKEAEQAKAEATREKERQEIETVKVTSEANRRKESQVIAAQAKAEQEFVEAQRKADADAYAMTKDAEARKAAADADAEAVTKKARADAESQRLKAEGERAVQMVPVDVEQKRVEIEQQRVNVLQQELQARSEHGEIAQEFELAKLRISKEAEVRIEGAKASAQLFGKINAQVFGTPDDVQRMVSNYMSGMGVSNSANGFLTGLNEKSSEKLNDGLAGVYSAVQGLAKKVGVDFSDENAMALIDKTKD